MPRKIRPIRVEGDTAYITLTKGYVAVIDAADVPLVEGRNWFAWVCGQTVYARRSDGRVGILMHRVLLNAPTDRLVDHGDGDGLNNRRKNLRLASNQQNTFNGRKRAGNTSGAKGVHWRKDVGRWQAQIAINGKKIGLGSYDAIEDAAAAYAKASAELHGEFGRAA
jgi:hypothetical protein